MRSNNVVEYSEHGEEKASKSHAKVSHGVDDKEKSNGEDEIEGQIT